MFSSDHSQAMEDVQKAITPSPTDSLNALAAVAEHQLHDRRDLNNVFNQQNGQDSFPGQGLSDRSDMDLNASYGEGFGMGDKIHRRLTRSASPSDAILIKRNAPNGLSSQTTPTSMTGIELPYGLPRGPSE